MKKLIALFILVALFGSVFGQGDDEVDELTIRKSIIWVTKDTILVPSTIPGEYRYLNVTDPIDPTDAANLRTVELIAHPDSIFVTLTALDTLFVGNDTIIDGTVSGKQDLWEVVNTSVNIDPALPFVNYAMNTSAGNLRVILPPINASNDGFLYKVTMAVNANQITVTTLDGLFPIGNDTAQIIVNEETGIIMQANSGLGKYEIFQDNRDVGISVGFDDPTDVTIEFDAITRAFVLNGVVGDYTYTVGDGSSFKKTTDTIYISDVEGFHFIFYDDDGNLTDLTGLSPSDVYVLSRTQLPVSSIIWGVTSQEEIFVTRLLKSKDMGSAAWIKNVFDQEIYVYSGFSVFDDPSQGGTITPSGSDDISAQFGVSAGDELLVDKTYTLPLRDVGEDWTVIYVDNLTLRKQLKTDFAFLVDTDFGLTTTGLAVYNNNGVPTAATSGNFIWNFVGISADYRESERVISFMGQNEYSTKSVAQNALSDERAAVEAALLITQGTATVYAFLIETKTSFTNTVKSRIVDFQTLFTAQGGSATSGVPGDLVNGGNTDALHRHSKLTTLLGIDALTINADTTATFESSVIAPEIISPSIITYVDSLVDVTGSQMITVPVMSTVELIIIEWVSGDVSITIGSTSGGNQFGSHGVNSSFPINGKDISFLGRFQASGDIYYNISGGNVNVYQFRKTLTL